MDSMFWISYLNLLSTYLLKCSYPDCIDLMKYATATLETQLSVFSRNNNNCSAHSLYIYLPLLSSPLSLSLSFFVQGSSCQTTFYSKEIIQLKFLSWNSMALK